jgi:hypothetical protein
MQLLRAANDGLERGKYAAVRAEVVAPADIRRHQAGRDP